MNSPTVKLLAQTINLRPSTGIANSVADLDIAELIPLAVNLLFVIAAVIFFFMLVLGGIRWITSGGDKGQTEAAKSQITSAIIGLAIVLSAYAIVTLLDAFFGTNLLGDLNLGLE
ncbi:hypothetical protein JXA63_04140 [Candidatus Woesebacteria bacterium]|nr:hypothetical protein [Candidatus Woesebacteria bacterium]